MQMSKKYLRICLLLVIISILMFAVIADSQTNKLQNFTSPYIRQICNFAPNAGICTECYQDTCYPLPLEYTNYVFDKYRDECVPLSYGGCSGNLNNFEIKEDCEATCPSFVKETNVTADPQETDSQNFTSPTHPTEICNLVPDMGLCTKCTSDGCYTVFSHFRYIFVKRYAYNKHKDECVPFPHGNCMGNDNNFGSKEACEATCPSLSKKTNITTNITDTQESQNLELCNLDVDYGVCTECNPDGHCHPIIKEIYTRFAYNKYEKKCLPFSYEGCGGNENNFRFKVDCEAICLGLATKTNIITDTQEFLNSEACNLDLDDGVCTECNPDGQCYPILNKTYIRYAYNKHENKCLPFTYGGCGGNNNNFISKVGCEVTCSSLNKKTSITTDSQEIESQNSTSATKSSEVCYLDLNYGVCTECDPDGHCHPIINEVYTRYAYNKYEDKCLPFSYEGCGGNGNNFISKVGCEATCLRLATKTDIITDTRGSQNSEVCNLDFDRGLCIECYLDGCYLVLNQVYTRYAYNKYENKCVPFTYGGCGGNKNNFRSKADCIATCSSRGKKTNKTTDPQEIESQNSTSAIQNSEACNLDPVLTYCYVCNETTCTPLSFPLRKYYYDKQTKKCERLPDTICGTNANSFISKIYCEITCLNLLEKVTDFSKTESQESTSLFRQVCNLFPDMGICTECYQDTCYPLLPEYTRYAYDKTKDECVPFSYGGCGGNFNNFMSKEACEITCLTLGNKTNVTADPQETDSQDFTSPTHPTEICNLVPNIGLCTHCNRDGCYSSISFYNKQHFSNRKFYAYNKHKDECELFPYAGCGGNVNNFNSKADCETACPSIGKKTNVTADPEKTESQSSISPKDLEICNLDPNVGYCNQCSIVGGNCYGPGLKGHSKYGYDKYKDKCNLYEHHGCGDNDNYFISREDCEATCLGRQTSVISDIVITEKPQSPSTQNPNICNLHADVGYSIDFGFRNLKNRYWYNKNTDKCESFIYLGNGGNDNNFESKTNCEATCLKQDNVQTQKQDICSLYLNNGSCSLCDTSNCVNSTRYWYNRNTEKCEQFLYSGCGGNNNNFKYKLDCEATCHGPASPTKAISPQVCYLGPNMGICYHCKHLDCSIAISPPYKRYYYNKYEKECMILPYGGCKGNANNFDSKEFCETLCNRAKKNINRYGFGFG